MANLELVLQQLREERGRAEQQLNQLNSAIAALEGVNGRGARRGAPKGRIVSALARRRMAVAQRARWARTRQQAPATGRTTSPGRSRLSAAARRRIAAAQRARWAKFRAEHQKKAA
jgi:hypothetical protein